MHDQNISSGEIAPGVTIAPTPDWVSVEPYPIPPQPNPNFIVSGLCYLLDDTQIDLCASERAWFQRRADLVTAPVGAERAAQFSATYDPAFERLEIHGIRVWRNGQVTDHTASAKFELLRREQNMERLQLDGRQTIISTLPDVRAGDVVETAYTRYGMRKSLSGRHAMWSPFEWAVGIIEMRLRMRHPKQRVIHERRYNNPPEATEWSDGDVVDRRWKVTEQPPMKAEQLTPPWVLQGSSIQWSEWRDWTEAADIFTPIYELDAPLPEAAMQEVDRIRATESTDAGRAAALLRFVQGGVRYLAISMGEGGFTPRGLDEVLSTRYGDCKDKSKLYTAMARKLGLDACPALVNTRDGYVLGDCLPSGQLFDHCIVRLQIGPKVYWLDPTRALQPSPLDKIAQCYFGYALPLKPGATLERMPDEPALHIAETVEKVTLGKGPDVPVRYEWEQTFRDWRAEGVREHFAREGSVGVFKLYTEDMRKVWPEASVVSQDFKDDVATNTVVVKEVYDLYNAWTLDNGLHHFHTRDLTLAGSFAPLEPGVRKNDIVLGARGRRTRRVEVRSAMPHNGSWTKRAACDAFSVTDDMRVIEPRWLVLEQSLDIRSLAAPAKDAETYRQAVSILRSNELALRERVERGRFARAQGGDMSGGVFWPVVGVCLIVILAILRALISAGSHVNP